MQPSFPKCKGSAATAFTLPLLVALLAPQPASAQSRAAGQGSIGRGPVPDGLEPDLLDFPRGRNVLLIIADDMGVDKVGVYNCAACALKRDEGFSAMPSTPTIDALASAGILFTEAWANPVCSPTRAGIYTGLHAFRHGVGSAIGATPLEPAYDTLPELLAKVGYDSGLFGKWHLGGCPTTDYGWDRHYGILDGSLDQDCTCDYCSWERYTDCKAIGYTFVGDPADSHILRTKTYAPYQNVDDALSWIASRGQNTSWFAVVAFNAPHTPLHTFTPDAADPTKGTCAPIDHNNSQTEERDAYNDMAARMDDAIETLLNGISSSVLKRTTMIFIGDNGTMGQEREDGKTYEYELVEPPILPTRAKGTVYEGGVHVPFIVADGYTWATGNENPGSRVGRVLSPGRVVEHPVHTVDLFATICEIASADGTSGEHSESLIPYFTDAAAASVRSFNFTEQFQGEFDDPSAIWAIRDAQYKLVVGTSDELYDLQATPYEQMGGELDTSNPKYKKVYAELRAAGEALRGK